MTPFFDADGNVAVKLSKPDIESFRKTRSKARLLAKIDPETGNAVDAAITAVLTKWGGEPVALESDEDE